MIVKGGISFLQLYWCSLVYPTGSRASKTGSLEADSGVVRELKYYCLLLNLCARGYPTVSKSSAIGSRKSGLNVCLGDEVEAVIIWMCSGPLFVEF